MGKNYASLATPDGSMAELVDEDNSTRKYAHTPSMPPREEDIKDPETGMPIVYVDDSKGDPLACGQMGRCSLFSMLAILVCGGLIGYGASSFMVVRYGSSCPASLRPLVWGPLSRW
jgi:hypothetical protein